MPARFKVSNEVRDVLRRSWLTMVQGGRGEWSLALPKADGINGTLDHKLYLACMKVIEGAGGKWDRKKALHLFPRDPREALGLAVETGVATNEKTVRQAFYTPAVVARRVVELAEIPDVQRAGGDGRLYVLEPSVGAGALLDALQEYIDSAFFLDDESVRVVAFDTDPAVEQHPLASVSYRKDFLAEEGGPSHRFYDRVLMNPPWANGQDVAHVLHALQFLEPSGILVAVMPASASPALAGASVTKRGKRGAWFLACVENVAEWFPLPDGSFKESGTDVKSGIVRMRRPS